MIEHVPGSIRDESGSESGSFARNDDSSLRGRIKRRWCFLDTFRVNAALITKQIQAHTDVTHPSSVHCPRASAWQVHHFPCCP